MHEFQMNLAADVIGREGIKNEAQAIRRNLEIGKHVRGTVLAAGGTDPLKLKIAEPIAEVKKRLKPPRAAKPKVVKVAKGDAIKKVSKKGKSTG